jgi:hypothetical protein
MAKQAGGQAAFYASPALGVSARFCRVERGLGTCAHPHDRSAMLTRALGRTGNHPYTE